jgi:hypothetical protein
MRTTERNEAEKDRGLRGGRGWIPVDVNLSAGSALSAVAQRLICGACAGRGERKAGA